MKSWEELLKGLEEEEKEAHLASTVEYGKGV
jgi:hypothetical protein